MAKFKTAKEAEVKRRELLDAQNEVNDKLEVIDEIMGKRELKDEEKAEKARLYREFDRLQRGIDLCTREYTALYQAEQAEKAGREHTEKKTAGEQLREAFKAARSGKEFREIVLGSGENGDVASSGAVTLSIQDMIPTLNEGLGLPMGVNIVTGVTGNEIWPVSLDDADFEEVGETVALAEQDLHFDNISPIVARSGATFAVSNSAIDNAVLANVLETAAAVAAVAAGNVAFARHAVAGLDVAHTRAHLLHDAHILVADGHRGLDGLLAPLVPLVDVEVCAADGGFLNLDQYVVHTHFGHGNIFHPDAFRRLFLD